MTRPAWFDGQTAVITGAASGIGRELARLLWDRDCGLALIDLDEVGLGALADELRSQREGTLSVHPADVSDRDRMAVVADEVATAHDGLHLLINNAGIGYEAAFQQTSLEAFDKVLGVNFWGVVHGCHFFLPHLAKAPRAHVVNLSSLFGVIGMPGQTAYCASKYAVRGFSEALWEELRTTTVGLTLVHPGGVATNIMKTSDGDDPELIARIAAWYEKNAMAPRVAAEQILTAVRKGRRRQMVGQEAYLADYVKRMLPVAGNKWICDLVIKSLDLEHMREVRKEQWRKTMVDGS